MHCPLRRCRMVVMYKASERRYDSMSYRRPSGCGLSLPVISLGLWHNFGSESDYQTTKEIITTAFDNGITAFDTANNYGPGNGSAEERLGEIIRKELFSYRDEIIVSTKAGYPMWPGPYGDGGSRKYLVSSLDQSLRRLGLDYVDIFYHHRPDRTTPLEETASALAYIVSSGRALYVALSNYGGEIFEMQRILKEDYHTPVILDQVSCSILNRRGDEDGTLFPRLEKEGIGILAFSPLSQGRLTDKYLDGNIPADSRAGTGTFLSARDITPELVKTLNTLNGIASRRGQKLRDMAINWDLERRGMTGVIVGARNRSQIEETIDGLRTYSSFTEEEENAIREAVRGISFRR